MTATPSIELPTWMAEQLSQASPDLLRQMVQIFAEALMSADADTVCGAAYGQRSPDRRNIRNGYRSRGWDTRAGSIELAVPKLREGSYFPDIGAVDQAERVVAPFRALGRPYADMVRPMRYSEIYEGEGPPVPFMAGTNFFADALAPADAETILEQLHQSTAVLKAVQLRVLGGALARVPNDATAFAHRDRGLFVNIAAMYMDPAET